MEADFYIKKNCPDFPSDEDSDEFVRAGLKDKVEQVLNR